jgi:general secretion pathway protein G
MRTRIRTVGGFTMIELLVVLAILGVLAAAVLPLGETVVAAQKERELREALMEIRGAIDTYKRAADAGVIAKSTESGFPPSLQALVDGAPGLPVASGSQSGSVYFLRQLPRDPFAEPNVQAAATWRLRSYASPPAAPAPGADVYDVHSSSSGTSLDGVPYAKW